MQTFFRFHVWNSLWKAGFLWSVCNLLFRPIFHFYVFLHNLDFQIQLSTFLKHYSFFLTLDLDQVLQSFFLSSYSSFKMHLKLNHLCEAFVYCPFCKLTNYYFMAYMTVNLTKLPNYIVCTCFVPGISIVRPGISTVSKTFRWLHFGCVLLVWMGFIKWIFQFVMLSFQISQKIFAEW